MNRIFQDNNGTVESLNGRKLSSLKCLYNDDHESEDVILFWLQTDENWLRIFIDGVYCGIDEYDNDESQSDLEADDDTRLVNHDSWIKDNCIDQIIVESTDLPIITLSILLSNKSSIILACDKNEICTLKTDDIPHEMSYM
ncbi:MAG: hypothetical protein ACI837_000598 [Crocinitomicaceae bacterium]|jgi:hypothetical protein